MENRTEIDKKVEEAIRRMEEARDKDKIAEYPYNRCIRILREVLPELEAEHKQYAEWLRELRELRRNRIGRFSVGCATCIHMKTNDYTKRPCDICCYNYFSKYESEVNADE